MGKFIGIDEILQGGTPNRPTHSTPKEEERGSTGQNLTGVSVGTAPQGEEIRCRRWNEGEAGHSTGYTGILRESGERIKNIKLKKMKTFGYLLMAVMACMTCSCRDEEPLPDPVPPVVEPENPGNPEEPDTGKVYLGIAPYHREHAGTEGRGGELEGGALPGSDSCRGCEHTLHF